MKSLAVILLTGLLLSQPVFAASTETTQASTGLATTGIIPKTDSTTAGQIDASACLDNATIWSCSESIDFQTNAVITEIPNAGTTGTTLNKLAKLSGAPSTALIAATTDIHGEIGVVVGNAGTSGNAQIAVSGQASCVFDGATTAGDYVTISSTTAGDCKDAGSSFSAVATQIVGKVLSTNVSAGTYAIVVLPPVIVPVTVPPLATGSSTGNTLTAPQGMFVCTSTCTVTPPVPAAGYEFCVMNDDNVSTVITIGNPGSGTLFEKTARNGYGTATTGTMTSGGAVGDMVCIVGRDSTHYLTPTYVGTWTNS